MKYLMTIALALTLSACASYSGYGLKPGVAGRDDVVRVMGRPAMQWQAPDGSAQLAYPRGPMGHHTYMVRLGPDGKLQSIENVLEMKTFSGIKAGMTKEEVLRSFGPSDPWGTNYFKARDELAWEWPYCDIWGERAGFIVLFDNSAGVVRSALTLDEFADPVPCGR